MVLKINDLEKLSSQEFINRLYHPKIDERIIITPMISKKQINNGIVDLRLGTVFILTKKTKFSNLDINDERLSSDIQKYQDKFEPLPRNN